VNPCSTASSQCRSAGCGCPACVVLSTLFMPVLGHSWDTDERVFVNGASGHAPPPGGALVLVFGVRRSV
jgi:hypothetical protein